LRERLFATRIGISFVVVVCTWSPTALGQVYSGTGNIHEVFVGTESESYLRYLDLTDTSSNQSWVIRAMSPAQLRGIAQALANHPWEARVPRFATSPSPFEFRFLSPNGSVRFNSQFPYGSNDAAIWAGRGFTVAAQGGFFLRMGPLSLTLLPTVFRAENSSFPLAASILPCGCGQPIYDEFVDRPQRFGTVAYQRVDPGQSTVRFDALGLSAGLSTANEGWGPSIEYPFVVGSNAAGFPRLFIGSSSPFPIFVGRAHLKVIYGRLDQSDYSAVTGPKFYASSLEPGRVRFASGVVVTFQPRGLDGLEIGGSRFIHSIWPASGIPSSYLRKPLQAFLKINQPGIDQQLGGTDNQLASLFARWAFRESGLEVYGEYGREDHSYDLRDFVQEPDHQRAYSLGVAKVFRNRSSQLNVLRVEAMNFQLPPLATTGRGEGSIYTHAPIRQGHTNRGQLLGADIGVAAAAASTVRWDHYSSGGRWAVFWRRNVRREASDPNLAGPSVPQSSDVLHAFGYERLKFTRRFDLTTSLTFMRDLSRDFSNSRSNLNAAVAITLPR
jgi:hypothetical protein